MVHTTDVDRPKARHGYSAKIMKKERMKEVIIEYNGVTLPMVNSAFFPPKWNATRHEPNGMVHEWRKKTVQKAQCTLLVEASFFFARKYFSLLQTKMNYKSAKKLFWLKLKFQLLFNNKSYASATRTNDAWNRKVSYSFAEQAHTRISKSIRSSIQCIYLYYVNASAKRETAYTLNHVAHHSIFILVNLIPLIA